MTINPQPKKKPYRTKNSREDKELRRQVFVRDKGFCQVCGDFAPLYDYDGDFNVFTCGHKAHIKGRGAGGPDTLENLQWKCPRCHNIGNGGEHAPRWNREDVNQ